MHCRLLKNAKVSRKFSNTECERLQRTYFCCFTDWYRGHLLHDHSKHGIFPIAYVKIIRSQTSRPSLDAGSCASSIAADCPITRETADVLRDWWTIGKQKYVDINVSFWCCFCLIWEKIIVCFAEAKLIISGFDYQYDQGVDRVAKANVGKKCTL